MKHPQLRRARKVGEAVFRGVNSVHTFEVFPLTTDIRDSAAVFIISRRITDRSKTGHHRAVCVGEADSIVSEIKRHKRAKCVKIHEANAICVLRENDRSARSQVIDDLVAARSFACIRNVSKLISKPTSKSAIKSHKVAAAERGTPKSTKPVNAKQKIRSTNASAAKPKTIKPAEPVSPATAKRKVGKAKKESSSTPRPINKTAANVVKIVDRRKKKAKVSVKSVGRQKAA